jgi:endonuclease YncB( thermonuclease family)
MTALRLLVPPGLVLVALLTGQSAAAIGQPQQIHVIDGDTITLNGKTIHLVGFIAPETRDAQCKVERDLGDKAASRLRELVRAGGLDYSPVMWGAPRPRDFGAVDDADT